MTNGAVTDKKRTLSEEEINKIIEHDDIDTNLISDGYHTFGELYDHRLALFVALSNKYILGSWKSKLHHDGSALVGWFIAGIGYKRNEQISYHLPMSWWDLLKCKEEPRAPEWDGHTPADVIERLKKL